MAAIRTAHKRQKEINRSISTDTDRHRRRNRYRSTTFSAEELGNSDFTRSFIERSERHERESITAKRRRR